MSNGDILGNISMVLRYVGEEKRFQVDMREKW